MAKTCDCARAPWGNLIARIVIYYYFQLFEFKMETDPKEATKKTKKKRKKVPKRFRGMAMNPNFGRKKSGWVDTESAPPETSAAVAAPFPTTTDEVVVKTLVMLFANPLISVIYVCRDLMIRQRASICPRAYLS